MDESGRIDGRPSGHLQATMAATLLSRFNRAVHRSPSPRPPTATTDTEDTYRSSERNFGPEQIPESFRDGQFITSTEEPLISFSPAHSVRESPTDTGSVTHIHVDRHDQRPTTRLRPEQSLLDLDIPTPLHLPDSNHSFGRPYDQGFNLQEIQTRSSSPPIRAAQAQDADYNTIQCDECHQSNQMPSYCNVCNEKFCDNCWRTLRPHRTNALTAEGVPHEKADYKRAMNIRQCLGQGDGHRGQEQMHQANEHTKWYGVTEDSIGDLILEDFGRWADVLAESGVRDQQPRYPGLVSFIGQTSAGKSTLIKVLIALQADQERSFDSPVAGSINGKVPTSGDVHLYPDPRTAETLTPILYADCEGLEGGEQVPLGASANRSRRRSIDGSKQSQTRRPKKRHQSSKRRIQWADNITRRTREYVVANLYPRLLFTFSDVIVFVSRNPKAIENTVERLLHWAAKALETSSNQPVLAHLVIALNASESNLRHEHWNVDHATEYYTSIPVEALNRNPKIAQHVRYWTERGRTINDATDLLQAYYKTVRVVRIPTGARPKLVDEQISKLYQEISHACNQSRSQKRDLRMLWSADRTQTYLQAAFDQFTKSLRTPFDFVKASFIRSAIPDDFGGSILRMGIKLMNQSFDPTTIFSELSYLVASCIMLDSIRQGIHGEARRIFPEHYMALCDDALDDFCNQHLPCDFRQGHERCINVMNGHTKGHQNANGKVFRVGTYRSSFSASDFRNTWRSLIFERLDALLKLHTYKSRDTTLQDMDRVAYSIHRQYVLRYFFEHVGHASKFVSHTTCFSCLLSHPEHTLPCGHIICTPCLKAYGTANDRSHVRIDSCPLHQDQAFEDFTVSIKPFYAGIRVLSLDGGGARGLAELEVLQMLESGLGGIPIRFFFDLVVGANAGGIIALGLGAKGWNAQQCTEKIEAFYRDVFRAPRGGKVWRLAKFFSLHQNRKYATSTLESALQNTFDGGDDDQRKLLFGGQHDQYRTAHTPKVAAVSTLSAGLRPVVLASYNRPSNVNGNSSYLFQRPENADGEFEIWEAARATSATPTFFKPFAHGRSGQEYLDGSLLHNNPVNIADAEYKLLWPERAEQPPDIILSIGSGTTTRLPTPQTPTFSFNRPGAGALRSLKDLYNVAVDHLANGIDADRTWRKYLQVCSLDSDQPLRYQRINVTLPDDAPRLDDVSCIAGLRSLVREKLYTSIQIGAITRHLIASSFFFEKTEQDIRSDDGTIYVTGSILSRLQSQSRELMEMGRLLRQYIIGSERPFFTLEELGREAEAEKIIIDDIRINDMIRSGRFLNPISIKVSNEYATSQIRLWLSSRGSPRIENEKGSPISGFPQPLCQIASATRTTHPAYHTAKTRSRRRTASQRIRQSEEIAKWAPVRLHGLSGSDPIELYSNPSYRVGAGMAVPDASTWRQTAVFEDRVRPRDVHQVQLPRLGPGAGLPSSAYAKVRPVETITLAATGSAAGESTPFFELDADQHVYELEATNSTAKSNTVRKANNAVVGGLHPTERFNNRSELE